MEMADPPPASWADGVQVEGQRLQAYLQQRQHTLMMKGAAEVLKHTLEPIPTTDAQDGCVHFGDSLLLRSHGTGGLLQADVADQIQVQEGSRAPVASASLSTGSMLAACPRNTFTVSRVHDDDEFGTSCFLHYGQVIRLGTSPQLQDQPLYLHSSGNTGGNGATNGNTLGEGETLVCLYPRAPASTHWRVLRAEASSDETNGAAEPVALGAQIHLENVATGSSVSSDTGVRTTSYGNEWRVFGVESGSTGSTSAWSFVNSNWAEDLVDEARRAGGAGTARAAVLGVVAPSGADPGELLLNPVARAEHDLRTLRSEGKTKAYEVLARLYPQLRRSGMHGVRRLRRMCTSADTGGRGMLRIQTFLGHLTAFDLRINTEERDQLLELFGEEADNNYVDYRRFFALMAPSMLGVREGAVQDAYAKLRDRSAGGLVEVAMLQRSWDPCCHPDVQKGKLQQSEAMQDFLQQWDITSADGLVSSEAFMDYYHDVSAAVESDEAFVELVRRGWGL